MNTVLMYNLAGIISNLLLSACIIIIASQIGNIQKTLRKQNQMPWFAELMTKLLPIALESDRTEEQKRVNEIGNLMKAFFPIPNFVSGLALEKEKDRYNKMWEELTILENKLKDITTVIENHIPDPINPESDHGKELYKQRRELQKDVEQQRYKIRKFEFITIQKAYIQDAVDEDEEKFTQTSPNLKYFDTEEEKNKHIKFRTENFTKWLNKKSEEFSI